MLLPLLALASGRDTDCVRSSVYCLGALAENEEVRARIVELGGLVTPLNDIVGAPTVLGSSYQKTSPVVAEP